jgi:amino acid transporter
MPRSGGDYVYLSRTLLPSIGFTLNFAMAIIVIFFNAEWISSAINPALTNTLLLLGVRTGNTGLIELANAVTSPLWIIGIGVVICVIFGILTIVLRPVHIGRFILILFIIGLVSIIPSYILVVIKPQAEIISAINNFAISLGAPENYYDYVIKTADLEGIVGPYPRISLSDMLTTFVLPYWVFQWAVFLSSYVSGETKEVKKSQLIGMAGCVGISLIFGLISLFLLYLVGPNFIHSLSWLYYVEPESYYIYPAYPGLNFIPLVLTDNVPLIVLTGIGYFIWFVSYVIVTFVAVSRCFFAWAFDRVFPSPFADVHPKFRTPYKAIILMVLISVFFLVLYQTGPVFFPMYWTTIPNVIVWVALGIAAILLPFRKRDVFEASPVNYRIGRMPLISIVGFLSLIPQLIFLYILSFDPGWVWGGALSWQAGVLTATTIVIGAIIYFTMKFYRKKKGVDVTLAFKEIPPA